MALLCKPSSKICLCLRPSLLTISIVVIFHTRASYWLSNGIGIVKVLTLVFIGITGLVVLGGHTSVPDPHANFVDAFNGKATPYGITNALYKIIFSYAGFENAFNVVNEVKVRKQSIRNCRGPFDTEDLRHGIESGEKHQEKWGHLPRDRDGSLSPGQHSLLRCCSQERLGRI